MGIYSMAFLPGSTHLTPSSPLPAISLPAPRLPTSDRSELCAGILHCVSDGEENTGWSLLLHKGRSIISAFDGFLGGWGEIKQNFITSIALFPPHFHVNLLLSWYLSEDIFSCAFFFSFSARIPASEGKHIFMAEENEPFHEAFCYGQKRLESDCVF